MVSYKDIFSFDTTLQPPPDDLSTAVYTATKLDRQFGGVSSVEPEPKSPSPSQTNLTQTTPTQYTHTSLDSVWQPLRVIAGAHQGWVRSMCCDPVTNQWFVTGSADSTIKVWDLASLALKATISGHIMGVRAVAVSSRSPYLFSGSEDKTVRCWDLERTNHPSGCQIRNYHGHVGGVYAMALHPELDLLFTGGRDQVVRAWDIRSRTEVMVLPGHTSDILAIASQIGDPQVITSSMDSSIRLWDIRNQSCALALVQHTKSIRLMVLHPEELTFASADSSGSIKQWVLPAGDLLADFGTKEGNTIINSLAVNPSDNTLFAGYDDGKMEFYNYETGSLLQREQLDAAIYTSCFDMLGLRLITGDGDKSIKIWGNLA